MGLHRQGVEGVEGVVEVVDLLQQAKILKPDWYRIWRTIFSDPIPVTLLVYRGTGS